MFLDLVMDIFEDILNAYSYCEPVSCRGVTTCASGSLYLEVTGIILGYTSKDTLSFKISKSSFNILISVFCFTQCLSCCCRLLYLGKFKRSGMV